MSELQSLLSALRPKRAGDMRYLGFGKDRVWLYVEWGDGVMIHLGPLGIRWHLRIWRRR